MGGKEEEEEEEEVVVVVCTRENRGGSAQYATRAAPTRSSHRPTRSQPYAIPIYSSAVAFIHTTLPVPSRMGRTSRSVQIRRDHSSLRPGGRPIVRLQDEDEEEFIHKRTC